MTDTELEKINAERRRRGKPPLSKSQATSAADGHDGSSDLSHFLIGYTTGIPMPSAMGVDGVLLHDSSPSYSAPEPSYSGGGGAFGGGGSSSSWDSGSSSSFDSGSSFSSGGSSD